MKKALISAIALILTLIMMIPVFAEEPTAETDTTLEGAQAAYYEAKQTDNTTEYESELQSMVDEGTLTQDQADILLTQSRESEALREGKCPECGYEFTTTGMGGNRRGYGKDHGMIGHTTLPGTASEDATELEQAQSAYYAAKQAKQLTDYETELNEMVAAGTLTQAQADLLLTAANEAESLANGTCPSCGYQFQCTIGTTGRNCGMKNGGRGGMGNGMKNGRR